MLQPAGQTSCFCCKKPLERKLQCSQCRIATYCSIECQRKHRKTHRLACRAAQAQRELSGMLGGCDLRGAEKDFHMAADQVEKLKEEKRLLETQEFVSMVKQSSAAANEGKNERLPRAIEPTTFEPLLDKRDKPPSAVAAAPGLCDYVIQDFLNLSCYTLRLLLPSSIAHLSERLLIQLDHQPTTESTVVNIRFDGEQMQIDFPGRITEALLQPLSSDRDAGLTIRLSYQPNSRAPLDGATSSSRMTPAAANTLACRFCNYKLIMDDTEEGDSADENKLRRQGIQSVAPLPSSRWDDMMDYLTCYPGQASVDFNTAMIGGQAGRILEDETALLTHAGDVLVSVLHGVPGYGQAQEVTIMPMSDPLAALDGDASFRGIRPWRASSIGPTVTCNCCASVLGTSSSPETIRLLKHRLRVTTKETGTIAPMLRVTAFIAYEMIRYAETKAIFAFRVRQTSHRECLVLRIIGWDNMVATSDNAISGEAGVHELYWKRMVQVVYEETWELEAKDNDNKQLWMWNIDWCCEPVAEQRDDEKKTSGNAPVSAVTLVLDSDEWNDLLNELQQGAEFVLSEIAVATVFAKTGSDRGSLSAIFLP